MRIGLISGEYPPMQGGISTQTRVLAEYLARRGHSVHVLTNTQASEQVVGVELAAAVTRWRWGAMQLVADWARTNRLDVVNMHYQTAAYGMSPWIHYMPELLRKTAPLVTTFHDLRFPYLFPKAGPLRDWIVMRLARASAGVVPTNQEDAARLAFHKHCALIPIGSNVTVEAASNVDARAFVGAGLDDTVLAFFGFVNRVKGLEDLLAAMVGLRERGITARLLMVGDRIGTSDPTNIPYAKQIDMLIADYGLTNRIHWTGFVGEADVRGYLTTADAVVMPFRDGASYRRSSMIVAIHHGAAVVTTQPSVDVPAFINGENLLLVPPNDVLALTAALAELYNNPALNQKLREGALALSREFSWERIVSAYETIYQQVTEDFA